MKIAVVGPGAMGCLFAALLTRAGSQVTLIDRSEERAALIDGRGVILREGDGRSTIPVVATADPATAGKLGLVIVMVKAHQTTSAISAITPLLGEETKVLSLQNGIGAADILASAFPGRVLTGTTAQGATLTGPGEIRHGGAGPTLIGPLQPPGQDEAGIVETFEAAGIPCKWEEDIAPAIWKKLAANCGINPIGALCNIRNGVIADEPAASALSREAVREVALVAKAYGVELGDPAALADQVIAIAQATAINRCSMGQDVDRSSPTEIEFINGAVARLAERHNIDAPVNRTLTRLILTLEAGQRSGGDQ